MHFVLVYPSPGIWGGIETLIVRMSHWLVANGHRVTVITLSDRNWGDLLPQGVRCIALGERFWVLLYYFGAKRTWRSLGIPQPDVIKSFNWEFRPAWIAYQLALITGARVAAGFYGLRDMLAWRGYRFHARCFLRNIPVHARVFMSPEQIDAFKEAHGQGGALWLLPVDSSRFLPATRRPIWGRLVSVGRLGDMKGYNLYMIDVVEELRRRGHQVTWRVHGVGEYEAEMRDAIRVRGLEQVITLAGPMPYETCRQVLADAHVFIGMGTAILEAALFKVPNVLAVAYDRGGVTYGPIYRVPHGSVGDALRDPPGLLVVDEIERILRLSPTDYAAEADKVFDYAQPYESDVSMRHFVEMMKALPALKRRLGPCVVNYLLLPGRVMMAWKKKLAFLAASSTEE